MYLLQVQISQTNVVAIWRESHASESLYVEPPSEATLPIFGNVLALNRPHAKSLPLYEYTMYLLRNTTFSHEARTQHDR